MHIRIDPVAGDAPVRLLRVEPIERRRSSDEREERRREERGASYVPAPPAEEPETYAPPAEAAQRPAEPAQLDPGIAALAARPPLAPPPAVPARDEEEQTLYPSGTPAWMTALLKAR
jgi:hypothetical protein